MQETQGVSVATFGSSKTFPAFYSHDSGCQAPYNVENAREAAEILGQCCLIHFFFTFRDLTVKPGLSDPLLSEFLIIRPHIHSPNST